MKAVGSLDFTLKTGVLLQARGSEYKYVGSCTYSIYLISALYSRGVRALCHCTRLTRCASLRLAHLLSTLCGRGLHQQAVQPALQATKARATKRATKRACRRLDRVIVARTVVELVATVEEESMTLDELCGLAPAAV